MLARVKRSSTLPASGGGQGTPGGASNDVNDKRPFTLHLDGSVDNIIITAEALDGIGSGNIFVTLPIKEIK